MVVQAHALVARKERAGSRVEIRFVLQPNIEILDFCGPVRREPHLDAPTDGPAPVPVPFRELANRTGAARVHPGKRRASSRVEEPTVLRVPEAPAVCRKPRLLYLIAEGDVGREI